MITGCESMSVPGSPIANARMYSVTPEVEALWRRLLTCVAEEAGIALEYLPYPAPRPLEDLWTRTDLGAVLMCGYPIALGLAPVQPIAAPIPQAPWAEGRALYRTDLIVRSDAPYERLEDTFAGRAGWTVRHSHSGFNALRHHLLAYRGPQRPTLYREMVGNLVTARNVLDAVRERRIEVGPLDAYWHLLIARHAPGLCEGVRVLASTALAPMPAFVASAGMAAAAVERLRAAFTGAAGRPWFGELAAPLMIEGFAPASRAMFDPALAWDREARVAGYETPA
jgi:ABC-type phosphate/phosphonate transport system substrate-binding protein